MSAIPSIDFQRLEDDETLAMLDKACREWGFFYLIKHNLERELRNSMLHAMQTFFALPAEQKQRIKRTEENPWGFYDRELTKETKDWKEILDIGPALDDGPFPDSRPQWPEHYPELKPLVDEYYEACLGISYKLLAAVARNLKTDPDLLKEAFGPRHSSYLRFNYYPLCDNPASTPDLSVPHEGYLGINYHTDAGALTVLLGDAQAGLEVFHDDEWVLIEPKPGALIINIGDVMQVWSNDRYRAPVHRVRASETAERYSAPFFFNPAYESDYAPLPGICDGETAHYRSINWGEFRKLRAKGDYADYGEEVQISRYRTDSRL